MDVTFKRKQDRELAEDESAARKRLGPVCAKKLKSRLADLRAATTVGDLLVGKPHPLQGDRSGQFAVTVHDGVRIVFEPGDSPVPKCSDDSIDWRRVSKAHIVFVGDYHD